MGRVTEAGALIAEEDAEQSESLAFMTGRSSLGLLPK